MLATVYLQPSASPRPKLVHTQEKRACLRRRGSPHSRSPEMRLCNDIARRMPIASFPHHPRGGPITLPLYGRRASDRHSRESGNPGEGPQVGGSCFTFTTSPSTGSYAQVSESGNPSLPARTCFPNTPYETGSKPKLHLPARYVGPSTGSLRCGCPGPGRPGPLPSRSPRGSGARAPGTPPRGPCPPGSAPSRARPAVPWPPGQ